MTINFHCSDCEFGIVNGDPKKINDYIDTAILFGCPKCIEALQKMKEEGVVTNR